jgi:hypothetical protein
MMVHREKIATIVVRGVVLGRRERQPVGKVMTVVVQRWRKKLPPERPERGSPKGQSAEAGMLAPSRSSCHEIPMHTDLDDACGSKLGVFLLCPDFSWSCRPLNLFSPPPCHLFFFSPSIKFCRSNALQSTQPSPIQPSHPYQKLGRCHYELNATCISLEESEAHLQLPSGLARAILASGGSSKLAFPLSPFFASRPL